MLEQARTYRIIAPIGKGGFGMVYRARMVGGGGFSKDVAVKVLHPHVVERPEVAKRLRDEARVLGMLSHRAILSVDGLVQFEGRWAIVMELANGSNLKEILLRMCVPVGPALEILGEVASALEAAWSQEGPDGRPLRLLHRDVKPSNIQVSANGDVKLLDFGIARADFDDREAETHTMFVGSPGYAAPERLDLVNGPEGDVYAMGVVLWEMLCGRPFGKARVRPNAHAEIVNQRIETVEDSHPDEHELCALLRSMLDYEPSQRPNAKTVIAECRRTREREVNPYLADWAKSVIPEMAANREAPEDDDWVGVSLMEKPGSSEWVRVTDVTGPSFPELERALGNTASTERPPRRRFSWGVAIVWASTLALAAVMTWLLLPRVPVEVLVPFFVESQESPVPEPEPPGESIVEPEPPAPAATRKVAPRPTEIEASPEAYLGLDALEEDVEGAEITVLGDTPVRLVGRAGTYSPGQVPPGSYRIEADFGDGWMPAGSLEVKPDQRIDLGCSAAITSCQPQ